MPILLVVDVFELEVEPENEIDLLEVLDSLPDSVSIADLVRVTEYVAEYVGLLIADEAGLGVVVPVSVRVTTDVSDLLAVSVLFGEEVILLLILDEDVCVIVTIADEVGHMVSLGVFVCHVVRV